MTDSPRKPYEKPMSKFWWVKKPVYLFYMVRDLSSLFVLLYSALIIRGIYALSNGEQAFNDFILLLSKPWMIGFHILTMLLVLTHAVTWFKLSPRSMDLRIMGHKVPDFLIYAGNYGALFVVTALIMVFTWGILP